MKTNNRIPDVIWEIQPPPPGLSISATGAAPGASIMHYQLYGVRFTRAMIVQMVLAEAGIDQVLHAGDEAEMSKKSLREALQGMALIERELQQHGPCQPGERFSLLDIILSFWAEYVNVDNALAPCPALQRGHELVRLRPCFDRMIEHRAEYTRLQQAGAGAD